MANVNAPFGMRPVRYLDGRPYNGACQTGFATGATGNIFVGDPVILGGAANTSEFAGYQAGALPTVQIALDGDGDPIAGVCVGVLAVTRDSVPYRETSTDRIILYTAAPDLIYIAQTDAASTAYAGTDVGSFTNMIVGTGNTTTGKSGWVLDTTDTPDTTDVSNQLLILRLWPAPNNAIGANSVWEVLINNQFFAQGADLGRATGV